MHPLNVLASIVYVIEKRAHTLPSRYLESGSEVELDF